MPLAAAAIIVTSCDGTYFLYGMNICFPQHFNRMKTDDTPAGGLYQLQSSDYTRSWGMFSAAAILESVPVPIIFFCIQKYMVSGLTAGGVKG